MSDPSPKRTVVSASNPLVWTARSLRRAISAAGVALWPWNIDSDAFSMDERGFALWNVPQSDEVKFEDLSSRIHPADRDRVRAAFTATRAMSAPTRSIFAS